MSLASAHHHQSVVIIDYGSQYTQLITRRIREHSVYSVVTVPKKAMEVIRAHETKAIILSGGPNSVYDPGVPGLPEGLLQFCQDQKIPVLGICYGMQLLVQNLGGKIEKAPVREYGRMKVKRQSMASVLLDGLPDKAKMWMSHGDETKAPPSGFDTSLISESGSIAAIESPEQFLYGLQFHPEVSHSEGGVELIGNFLFKIAKIKSDWTMSSIADEEIADIRALVADDQHAICALSGGVDSTVAARLVHRALGDRLHCVFVDHGLLRYQEQSRVMEMFREHLDLPVTCVDASERFLSSLNGVVDPEKKRKIIGKLFIDVFDEYAESLTQKIGHKPKYLVQGTLYPDVIESSPPPSSGNSGEQKHSHTIKSHHNVGGLPEDLEFDLIEPLRDLFKDEVRALGAELGVPTPFLRRHPFPGPGLAVRIIGEITPERVGILQRADEVYIQALHEFDLYDQIWQAFAVFLPIKSVGVQGDGRTHDHVVGLRAVTSKDGMTADWFPFPADFLAEVSNRISNQVDGVNRVVYDISSKPPATIEWE